MYCPNTCTTNLVHVWAIFKSTVKEFIKFGRCNQFVYRPNYKNKQQI